MKEFEERFSELQADMVSICMEYVEIELIKYMCTLHMKKI